jgi:hypothetical protein
MYVRVVHKGGNMDKVVGRIASLGVPGLVLVVAMGATGLVGAAAITAGLALPEIAILIPLASAMGIQNRIGRSPICT